METKEKKRGNREKLTRTVEIDRSIDLNDMVEVVEAGGLDTAIRIESIRFA
jgi:hypothetical protein